ncbi:MobF family relaxase [Rarobacter faecitabidus]|uniref:Conjugative relaxase-like TrwC/TraI family protein n=1 Tax=Rarobacter faecitabidus TaxID=13243 RepID=A0A542ZAU9_RARFA|nr:MobF family relaxase [Rarobacter faecitabidus]TQL57455.1 conjugative relaxase-like TrwC/TraI family protein [Rarobacter faecitabidus]
MSLTRLTAAGGVDYLLKTVAAGDATVAGGGLTDYYAASGNPPGRWWGGGAAVAGLADGSVVSHEGADRLFRHCEHPLTGEPLGVQPKLGTGRSPVAGFDCTFTIPKSVAVVWAVADRRSQELVMAAHERAIDQALSWLESEVIQTRSGRGGVASEPVDGIIAARFDHYTSRDGDPHPHVHAVIANRVRRSRDGKWLTIDSRSLHKAAVAASELHQNLFLDEISRTLGWGFVEREDPGQTSRAVIMDLDGVDSRLLDRFSSRDRQIREREAELTALFVASNGREPGKRERAVIHRDAWRDTRRPKDERPEPLTDSMSRWRTELRSLGIKPGALIDSISRSDAPVTGLRAGLDPTFVDAAAATAFQDGASSTITDSAADKGVSGDVDDVAAAAVEATMGARSTWSRLNLRAEVERLTRHVRCDSHESRSVMVEAITDRAIEMSVPLTARRYAVMDDHRLVHRGRSVFDDPGLELFTHGRTLAAEDLVLSAAHQPFESLTPEEASQMIAEYSAAMQQETGFSLGQDQVDAVVGALSDGRALSAIVGPAGTGKTSAMRILREAWEVGHGAGSVIGLTTSAQAAAVLGEEIGAGTDTVAKWLFESVGGGVALREKRALELERRIEGATSRRTRGRFERELVALRAHQAHYRMRPGQLVIIDEASMTGTFPMAEIVRQARAAGAKVLLVGDPAQLGAPEAGGLLARLDRENLTSHLTAVWRFRNDWEAKTSLKLRAGDVGAIADYAARDRIRHGVDETMLDGCYQEALTDLAAGHDTLLVVGTNETMRDMNTRFTLDRRAAGLVDTTTLAALRSRQDAGVGDVIVSRHVDRTITDTAGDFMRNGTLMTVLDIAASGEIRARRHDNNAEVTLPVQHVREHTDLGYAMTAHRAQGSTVDRAHVAIPTSASLPRELLYVAMTRGRDSNTCWVGEETVPDDHTFDEDGLLRWQDRLAKAITTSGAERSATQVRLDENDRQHNLAQLHAERDHLLSLIAPPVDPLAVDHMHTWIVSRFGKPKALVNDHDDAGASRRVLARHLAWLQAQGHDVNAVINQALALRDTGDADDMPALIHWRLTHLLDLPMGGTPADVDMLAKADPHLYEAITQVGAMIMDRERVLAQRPAHEPWARDIPGEGQAHAKLVTAVRCYREQWSIDPTEATPLGPAPDARSKTQARAWLALKQAMTSPRTGPATVSDIVIEGQQKIELG